MALAKGRNIADRYRLERRIAVGGMGEVWEASDMRLGRSVAIKVLKSELSHDGEFLHRFRIEAQTVASLSHIGIAAVHDYGEDDTGGPRLAYLVMELVRGEPLSARLAAAGRIDAEQTVSLLEQTGHALQAAHERGFVHRDVKPGNILITEDGLVKITDFGIAKASNAVPVTASGMVMGTAHYIAPEQAMGGEAGPAGDVYSLGIVGYECLAGRRPFQAENPVTVAMMQIRDTPPPLPADVPAQLRALIDAALVKDPRQRYTNGGEFAMAAAAVRRGMPLPRPGEVRVPAMVEPRRPVDAGGPDPSERGAPARGGVAAAGNAPGAWRSGAASAGDARRAAQPAAARGAPAAAGALLSPISPVPAIPGQHRLPIRGRTGRNLLVVLFVLLTAASIVLGTFVVRDAMNKPPVELPVAAAPEAPPPADGAVVPVPPGSVEVNETFYVGRSATVVKVELKAQAVVPKIVNARGVAPANEGGCTVTAIAPKGIVKINSPITVTCMEPIR